jgi:hypothetical protein
MIHESVVQEVKRLLFVEGLSQRNVAAQTGVSRGSVHAIARGKRPDPKPRSDDDSIALFQGPPQRCPSCGGLVYMPCLLCRVRTLRTYRTVRRVG